MCAYACVCVCISGPAFVACRWSYQRAANPFLGSAVSEWFIRKSHAFATNAAALSAKASLGTVYVDIRYFGHDGGMNVGEASR